MRNAGGAQKGIMSRWATSFSTIQKQLLSVHPCWLPLARIAYNHLKPNAVHKSPEPSKIRNKHNSHVILELESNDEIMQQNKNSSNNSAIENHQEEIIL